VRTITVAMTPAANPIPRAADGERREINRVAVVDGELVVIQAGDVTADKEAEGGVNGSVTPLVTANVGVAMTRSACGSSTRNVLARREKFPIAIAISSRDCRLR
jgi:hypothetical protein